MRESVQRPKSRKWVMAACCAMCVERGPAGVGRGDQRAHAGAGDEVDGDFVLFEHAQHSNMRDAARESAAERHANVRAVRRRGP